METKTIKISKENYAWLCQYAGKLQQEGGQMVSLDAALTSLRSRARLSDLAGSWSMSDAAAHSLLKDIRKRWGAWNKKFV